MEHEKKEHKFPTLAVISVMGVIILLLGATLFYTLFSYKSYRDKAEQVTVSVVEKKPKTLDEALLNQEVIKTDDLKGYVAEYGVSLEFVQRFFPDNVVYRNGKDIIYAEIDKTLPQNNYDFQKNLIHDENGKLQYQENGVNKAIKGIDVSKHQGNIDWKKVANSGMADYAMLRVGNRGYTTGKILSDENFHENAKGAIKSQVPIGAYFYSQAITKEEAIEEAQFVIDQLKGYKIDYPVAFDLEEVGIDEARTDNISVADMTDITIAFCEEIEKAGYKSMIYGNVKWFMARVDLTKLTKYDKWFAQYYNTPFFPYELSMWQYTGSGKIDGIKGNVDINLCFDEYIKTE